MVIKNITDIEVDVIGVSLLAGEELAVSDIGSAMQLRLGTDEIVELIASDKIAMQYADGVAEESVQKIVDILDNRIATVSAVVNDAGQYYYLRDTFEVKSGSPVLKKFKGRVHRIAVTPWGDAKFGAKTCTGLVMPEDGLPPKETFELKPDHGSDIAEVYLATDKPSVWVTVIMDGYSSAPVSELQPFINGWRE